MLYLLKYVASLTNLKKNSIYFTIGLFVSTISDFPSTDSVCDTYNVLISVQSGLCLEARWGVGDNVWERDNSQPLIGHPGYAQQGRI